MKATAAVLAASSSLLLGLFGRFTTLHTKELEKQRPDQQGKEAKKNSTGQVGPECSSCGAHKMRRQRRGWGQERTRIREGEREWA